MRSLGTRKVELNLCDFPSSSGECDDDKLLCDTVPIEDTFEEDDVFETQIVNYDDSDLTQPFECNEETQMKDLAGETQIVDDFDDFDGDTQLLVISDTETKSDKEGPGRTHHFDATVHLSDIQIPDKISNQSDDGESTRPHCRQDDGGARAQSTLPADDATQPSGFLRRGVSSVRTASLRAAGIAARKVASKNAEIGSCSTATMSGSSKCVFVNDDGIYTGGRVGLEDDITNHDENASGNGHKTDVARSLARKLFMEEVAEEGSDKDLDFSKEGFSQLPGCDNELAGLSYVDSQEPGELSQANALEFVDRFLKVNLLEPDENVMRKNIVGEIVTPCVITKGANSIAQDANRRSRLATASAFEWDDRFEDEGGGEFFTKKRELLVGNSRVARKSAKKTRTSRHSESKGTQFSVTIRNEKQQNVHDAIMGFLHSDSKLVKSIKDSQADKIDVEKRAQKYADQESHLDACDVLASAAPHNAESAELLNVGIDTQMAAEAMEALSTATAFVDNGSRMASESLRNKVSKGESGKTNDVSKKRRSTQKGSDMSNARVVTRSQCKSGGNKLRLHSQHLTENLKVDMVKPRVKRSRVSVNYTSGDHNKETSEKEQGSAHVMGIENNSEECKNQVASLNRKSSRKKENTLMPGQKNAQLIEVDHFNKANSALSDSSERRHCLDGAHYRKRRTQSDVASTNPKARVETANSIILGDCVMVDGSSDNGRDLQQTYGEGMESGKNGHRLTAYEAREAVFGSVARRTRSKRSAQSAHCLRDENGLSPRAMLSLEKLAACSPPAKRTLASVSLGGSSCKQNLSCPVDVTPDKFKKPGKVSSPICMGDECHTPSRKKILFLKKECSRLTDDDRSSSPFRVLRQRRDMNNVLVLFSQHLDEDIVRHQRKILLRLGFSEAASVSEATHFVADMFMRTRNMLEAIANAKLVVTHQWLESCGQANCFIDEKKYILRDTKKEKELGFSMPMSLARASRHPLLEGRRVLLTPNIKPSKDIISGLVKSVRGQAIGRLCRSTSNNYKLLSDLLVLSCEEDFEVCLPLLERGIAVYNSELLLNGIITQRLEYERHSLFVSHVKKTRSNLWLKKEGDKFLRVPRIS